MDMSGAVAPGHIQRGCRAAVLVPSTQRATGNRFDVGIVQHFMMRRGLTTIAITAMAALVLGACAGDDDAGGMSDTAASEEAPIADDAYAYSSSAGDAADYDAKVTNTIGMDRDLIITIGLGLESTDAARTVAVINNLVAKAGGLVTSSEIGYGDVLAGGEGWATMVVRIPPEEIDRFTAGLDDPATAARITSENRSSADVTDQLVELDVRIDNQRESVDAIRRLMDDAVALSDVVMLERELNDRQTELEVMLAQQAMLADRVALATITIDIYAPGTAPERSTGISDGFVDGWGAFVSAGSRVIYLLAAASPFLGVLVAAGVVLGFIRRRR